MAQVFICDGCGAQHHEAKAVKEITVTVDDAVRRTATGHACAASSTGAVLDPAKCREEAVKALAMSALADKSPKALR